MDLTEAEDIKKRWQEYTEELHKKDLNHPDNHDGVITHLEPDILDCKDKCKNKSLCSQSYGFPITHVRMWELDHKEGRVLKNWYFWTVILEKILEWVSLWLQGDQTSPS